MRRLVLASLRGLTCASIVLGIATTASAQFKAGVQGSVMDPTGAVIPGATVALTNNETGRTLQTTTSGDGFYRIAGLPPGKYTMSAEHPGFNKKILETVTINAEAVQGIDITLDPGEIAEAVTVTAESGEQLKTENPNIDRAITNREVLRLPQVGRDPYELIRLSPGVFGDGARAGNGNSVGLPNTTGPGGSNTSIFQVENQVPVSANGQRLSANNYQIDGVSVNSLGWAGAAVVTPNQESVKEIRVQSTSYSAEDGRNTGAQIKVVSQNGTNEFHGSGVFKYNSPKLNAFNKFGGITGDPTKNAPPVRNEQLYRQFAGSLGGPIIKNKVFFFFSYEGLRNSTTNISDTWIETSQYRQLVMNQRAGGVTAGVFAAPGIEPRIITELPSDCSIFNNNRNLCRVVNGGLDIGSLTGSLGRYVRINNSIGGGLDGIPDIQFVRLQLPSITRGDQYNTRIDYNRGNDQFAVSTYITRRNDFENRAQSRPIGDLTFKPMNSAGTATWIRTISPTILNEARANFTRFAFDQVASNPNVNWGIPRIHVEGIAVVNLDIGADRSETTPALFAQSTFEVRDTLTKVHGNMALKFGAEIRREQDNNNLAGGARPSYTFKGLWNLANDAPFGEDINTDPNTGKPADAQRYFRTGTDAFFAQDDWKIKPNLTLNIGLRYEYFTPLREKRGRISNLVFPPGDLAHSKMVVSDQLFEPDRNNFAPHLGVAWSPTAMKDKLVLRGGLGIGYNRIPGVLFGNTRGNPPFFARHFISNGGSASDGLFPFAGGRILYVLGTSSSLLSYPINLALAQGIDPATGGVIGSQVEIYGTERKLPNAYVYFYSLEAEYELPWNLIASLSYQGSSSHKLIRITPQNLLYQANPFFRPVYFLLPDVNGNYNAMIARLTHNFAKGFRVDGIYRWSKSIDTLSYEGPGAVTNQTNPGDLASERGPSDYDVKHHFVLSGLWDLPLVRGHRDFWGKAFGGWQMNGIFTAHSGFPWTPKIGQNLRQPSGEAYGPIRPTVYFGGALDDHSDAAFIRPGGNFPGGGARYFDIVTVGPPGIGRNSFRGPQFRSTDLSLIKQTGLPRIPGLGEGPRLEIRFNFLNVFNELNLQNIGFFSPGSFADNPNFGRSQAGLSGRVIEFQARFSF
jgi:hypothetical protein